MTIRVLAFVEAHTVTGPAKNLIDFATRVRSLEPHERVEVEIAIFERAAGDNAFTEAVTDAGIPLHRVAERGPYDMRAVGGLRTLVSRVRPTIVQTHAVKSHFLVRASAVWKNMPWVASHHGYTRTSVRTRLYNALDRWSLRAATRVLTMSRSFEAQLRDIGVPADRITVQHNGIDPAWGDPPDRAARRASARASLGIADNERAILIVGRLSREKSHAVLVRALAALRRSDPDIALSLIIVGDGPERGAIDAAALTMGMRDRVIFVGQVADVLPYYAAADVAVLSSLTEGSPNALLEAMAARVPVVATAVGGIPEMVTHGDTALLVPSGDVNALADSICQALRQPEDSRAMADRARALVVSRYSSGERMIALARFYADVAGGHHQD
ncbi:MAG: glycosyltransferase [bacterium]